MWSIGLIKNEPKIPKKCAAELFKIGKEELWYERSSVLDKEGRLTFNDDHAEHMDYLSQDEIRAVLCKHKVKGDICFGSLEGDNAGSFWGYRFDGNGGCVTLSGNVTFTEDVPQEKE